VYWQLLIDVEDDSQRFYGVPKPWTRYAEATLNKSDLCAICIIFGDLSAWLCGGGKPTI